MEIASQLDLAIKEIAETKSAGDESIHRVRRRCKRIRALLDIMSDQGVVDADRISRLVRDAGRQLSPIRDAQIIPAAQENVRSLFVDQLNEQLLAAKQASVSAPPLSGSDPNGLTMALNKAARKLNKARRHVAKAGEIDERPLGLPALANAYDAGRKEILRLRRQPSEAKFHRFRKAVKTHLYQCKFFAKRCKVKLTERIDRLETLAEHLGSAQDVAVLRGAVHATVDADDRSARQEFDSACQVVVRKQHQQALLLAYELYFDTPKKFIRGL